MRRPACCSASLCAPARICFFPRMPGDADEARALDLEARLFARYLVGRPPPAELVERYRAANAAIFTEPVAREDAALVAFARRHPWSVSLLDAASGLLRPGSLLRNKILLMAAILETSPAFADEFLPRDARPLRLLLALLAHGTLAVARAALGAVVYAAAVSLARGGLGAGWSAGVFPFTDDELGAMGLGLDELGPHYDAVAERIGVCGAEDDLQPFLPESPSIMPPLELDSNAEVVLTRYLRRRAVLNAAGFFLGRTRLAACTERHRERGPYAYLDLDYWADMDRSVYRPQWTLEELLRAPNFTYLNRRFVHAFSEDESRVRVRATRADSGEEETHEAAALVLAGGTLGTARIVLASLGAYDRPVPILCNAYAYVPTLNLGMLRRPARDRRSSLAQLTALLRIPGNPGRIVQAQLFSYRSLLTFKLMKESPLAYREGLRVLRVLIPKFAILGIHHEDRPATGKTCVLHRGGGADRLDITYRPSEDETRRH